MPASRGVRTRIIKATLFAGALALAAFVGLWQMGWPQRQFQQWLQNRIIKAEVRKLEPHLPFKIEYFEVEAPWHDFKSGRIRNLSAVLLWDKLRIRLQGPLELQRAEGGGLARALMDSTVSLEWAGRASSASSVFRLTSWVEFSRALTGLSQIGIDSDAAKFEWKTFGIEVDAPAINVLWENGKIDGEIQAQSVSWTGDDSHAVRVEKPGLDFGSLLALDPLRLGDVAQAELQAQSAEILWGGLYLDPTLKHLPTRISAHFNSSPVSSAQVKSSQPAPFPVSRATLELGPEKSPRLKLGSRFHGKSSALERVELDWKSSGFPLADLLSALSGLPEVSSFLAQFKVPRGTVRTHGAMTLRPGSEESVKKLSGNLEIRKADLLSSSQKLAIRRLDLDLPFDLEKGIPSGRLSVDQIDFRRFKSQMKDLRFSILPSSAPPGSPSGAGPGKTWAIQTEGPIPLHIDSIPLQLGPLRGQLRSPGFQLNTSLEMQPTPLSAILNGACAGVQHIPPAQVRIAFPALEITSDSIDPTGSITADLFGGSIAVQDIAVFDHLSEVPELNFSSSWSGIRLDEIGSWLGFGEMDGTLVGYAKEVTFQAWLPTQYEFRAEAKPRRKSDIVFSPDAMRNFVQVVAGDGLESLPGIAKWFVFGWPSRVFGGYDVRYAGIHVESREGNIIVRTLDPPKIFEEEQKRFILYGDRFKMPLLAHRYPLIVDATAMARFVRQVSQSLSAMAEAKAREKGEFKEKNHETDPNCLPAGL